MREYGDLMLVELRKVIPAFLKRVDVDDAAWHGRGTWRETREHVEDVTGKALPGVEPPRTARRGHADRLGPRRRGEGRRGRAVRRRATSPTISSWRRARR